MDDDEQRVICKQMKEHGIFPGTQRNLWYMSIVGWLIAHVLLATACGPSKPTVTVEPQPQSIATPPSTIPVLPTEILSSQYLRFARLTTNDGLSSDQTYHVAQDCYGFMWFATADGLNRYDGSDIKIFRHDPNDPSSLSNNVVRAMIVDQNGDPWLGTYGGGLNHYDPKTNVFNRFQHDPDDPHSLSSDLIRSVYEDRDGRIWIGTAGGLNRLDRESGRFTYYQHDPNDPDSLSHDLVWSIFEDRAGVLWVGTEEGLNRFDPSTEQFIRFHHDPDDPLSLSHDTIREIFEDRSGILWLSTPDGLSKFDRDRTQFTRYIHDTSDPQSLSGNVVTGVYEDRDSRLWVSTWGAGLNRFDRKAETFTRYRHDPADPYSLGSDTVFEVYEDQQGMFWIATVAGISFFDGGGKPFQHYRFISNLPNTLSHNVVRAIYAGRSGVVLIGTEGGGINKFDRNSEEFIHYRHDPANPESLSNDTVRTIYEDELGLVWVGTEESGLSRLDPETERFFHFEHDPNDPASISKGSIMGIREDSEGSLWISTWGGGLNAFDRKSEQFIRYQHDPTNPQTLSHNQVIITLEDQEGELWIGTFGGLNRFNREAKTFTRYLHDASNPRSLVHNSVTSIHQDETGTLWIGTLGGLDKYEPENDQFTHYTTVNGLPSEIVWGILEDEQGRLWLSTANGLSRFDPQTEIFRNYDVNDGLQSNTFLNFSSYSKSQNGEMYFGGSNGFNAFYPEQIGDNLTPPPVLITDFQLANQPVPIGDDAVLQKSILETDELELSYLDDVFSFEFVGLNYRAPEQNRYKYKLEGFEDDWNEVEITRRFATYTNLDPGNYVFRVVASNNDGVWNEQGDSIRITITPPWWETTWFRGGMFLLLVGLVAGVFVWQRQSVRHREQDLETQVAERTQELRAANQAKSQFLANMSHELRTPINAILGFTRLIARDEGLSGQQQDRLRIINRSGEHLLDMISDILTLSRIEAGHIDLTEITFDFQQVLGDMERVFRSRAEGKGLQFILELADEVPPYLFGDAGKLRQVLFNLLDNAVKYTPEGWVSLRARTETIATNPDRVRLELEVADSGLGIPDDKLEEIFETFARYEVADQTPAGTGLGLSIAKSLVEMLDGEIAVESEVGQGTRFTIKIPMRIVTEEITPPEESAPPAVVGLQPGQPEWRVLVVDDNRENRLLLTDLLVQAGFIVQGVENGAEAVAKFQAWQPDFIWMDVRMPELDGYAATDQIRALPGGDTVKIVAVTASIIEDPQQVIQDTDIDDLVLKPFREPEIFAMLARELGVEYVYREPAAAPAQPAETELSAEMLADLSPKLLQELNETTLVMDREATLEVIERIEAYAPETAASLRTLVENYQLGRVRDFLKEAEMNNNDD